MKKQYHRDVWVGLVLLCFCAALLYTSIQISGEASYLPIALSVMMGLCSAMVIVNGLRKTATEQGEYKYANTIKSSKTAFIFMLYIFIYFLGFQYISYWVATPIFMILAQKHLKVKSWKVNIIVTVLYMIISYIVFVIILKLPIYKVGLLGQYFRFI